MPAVAHKAWTYTYTHVVQQGCLCEKWKNNPIECTTASHYRCHKIQMPWKLLSQHTSRKKCASLNEKYATNLQTQTPPILLFQSSIAETKIAGAKSPLQRLPTYYVRALRVYQKYRICASPDVVKMCEAGRNSPPQTKRTKTSPQINTNTLLSFALECCAV